MPLAQRIAALPGYISTGDNNALTDAAPGHRYQMYLRFWQGANGNTFSAYKKCRPQGAAERATFARESADTLKEACPLGKTAKAVLTGLRQRQHNLIATYGNEALHIPATSTAPFATGLGNEHPIENGFAFLTPYGLPYLAGSGVKGVLRRAAEELALFPEEYDITAEDAPTLLDVWWLFGFEGAAGAWWSLTRKEEEKLSREQKVNRISIQARFDKHLQGLVGRPDLPDFICRCYPAQRDQAPLLDNPAKFLRELDSRRQDIQMRGALDCWDVFPAPAGDKLVVEIMTPHHAGYYMNGNTPHDAESPIPVPFLAVPALSAFDFHVVCASNRLPESMRNTWRIMLDKIFRHAFDWLGFGAKTAVGYGAMEIRTNASSVRPASASSTATTQAKPSSAPPTETHESVWPTAKLSLNVGTGEIKASFEGKTTAGIKGDAADGLRLALGERANKLKKDKELKNVAVRVSVKGNLVVLLALSSAGEV
jgi:CRISPR-associated protein Cmr6